MLRKPGDLPHPCPRSKKFKRLATRDTLHGSRPNLQQRHPNSQIVPTPPYISDKGASTKRCVRKKKKNDNYIPRRKLSIFSQKNLTNQRGIHGGTRRTFGPHSSECPQNALSVHVMPLAFRKQQGRFIRAKPVQTHCRSRAQAGGVAKGGGRGGEGGGRGGGGVLI